MVQTLTTRQQSDAIRAEMCRIRTKLPYDVDAARVQVKQMIDWKYHLRQHPLPILGAVALLGYLVVPSRMMRRTVFVSSDGTQATIETATTESTASKGGILAGLLATAGSIALRSGTSLIMRHVQQQLMSSFNSAKETNPDDNPLHDYQADLSSESKRK